MGGPGRAPWPGHRVYQEVERVSAALSALGCDMITGGGPGLMQAANEGAEAVQAGERGHSIGIRVELPFEHEVNPFVDCALACPPNRRVCAAKRVALRYPCWPWCVSW